MRPVISLLALLTLLAAGAACTSNDDLTPTTPTAPATQSETFTGTLTPNGARTEPFSVTTSGTVTATLTKVEPDATVAVGLSLGTWDGAACSAVKSNDKATQGTAITLSASGAGRVCVRVYDAGGTLTEPITYEVTVVHP
jgi:hypothetical protein